MSKNLTNLFLVAMMPQQPSLDAPTLEAYHNELRYSDSGVQLAANMAPTMVGDYGIEQLEDITDALVVAGQVYTEAMADGKVNMFDAFNLPKLIEPINAVNEGKELTGKEAFDLFDQEATVLIENTVRKAERLTDDTVTLSVVKQISRIVFGSLTLASIIKRKQNAAA